MPEIDLPNAEVDVDVDPNVSAEGTDPGAANPEPELFLDVDERTKFKTAEDAKKAFHESGKRIAQLSSYEKAVKRYGIADAQQLPTLLDELIAFREAKAAADKAPKADAKAEPQNLSKEDKEIREYLKKVAPELGFVSKSEIDALKAELTELKSGVSGNSEAHVRSLIEEGQSAVAGFLSEAKIEDPSGKRALVVEKLIRADLEADPEKMETFMKGGRSMKTLLKELSDQALETLGWTSSADATKPNASAAHALSKGKQIVANRKLPAADSARTGAPEKKASPNAGKRDFISELHEKAAKVFQESMG